MLKKSVQLTGHKTSVALEPVFWQALDLIAKKKKISLRKLIMQIDSQPERTKNLSSALRVYVIEHKDLFIFPSTKNKESKQSQE